MKDFWILKWAEKRKAAPAGSNAPCHGGKGSRTSASRNLAVCYLSRLLVPEQGSGMWQPLPQLTAEKSLAKASSWSHFVCTAKPFYSVPQGLSLRYDELRASRGCLVSG